MKSWGAKIFLILSLIIGSGFFIGQNCLAASEVVVNEVAWMEASTSNEWLELKNLSGGDINLNGWTLNAVDGQPEISLSGVILSGGYFLLERKNKNDKSASEISADLIYAGILENNGEILELRDSTGNLIDRVDASLGWPAGDNNTKQTMERALNNSWCSSQAVGGTPKIANDCASEVPPVVIEENSNTGGGILTFGFGDIVINEFLSNPLEGEDEWLELYNRTGANINLKDWFIVDSSKAKTVLEGSVSGGQQFFVLKKPKGALNNSGDDIGLFSPDGVLIDQVIYGDYGSSAEKNAPAPGKGFSCALKKDGEKLKFFKDSFALTNNPTPLKPNIIFLSGEAEQVEKNNQPEDLIISEILPNPSFYDREAEFIEFYNQGEKEIDLTGWRLEIRDGKKVEFGKNYLAAPILKPKSFFVFWRSNSRIALDNNGGRIELYKPNRKTPVQILEYPQAGVGDSFCDTQIINLEKAASSTKSFLINSLVLERWVWSSAITPGKTNEIKVKNRAPKINFSFSADILATGTPIIFDGSDSVDEDGNPISFKWDLGDGTIVVNELIEHTYLKGGEYKIKLEASDGLETAVLEKTIIVSPFIKLSTAQKLLPVIAKNTSAQKSIGESASINYNFPLSDNFISSVAKTETSAVELKKIDSLDVGGSIRVEGQVLLEPGLFGKQYFYIIASNSPALKIYNYYSEFPELTTGDRVAVVGEMAGGAEKYLKIKTPEDVVRITSGALSEPEKITENLSNEDVGRYAEIEGKIKKEDAKIFLTSEIGETRIFLKTPTNLSAGDFEDGQTAKIRGLIINTTSGLALAPRGAGDLFFNQEAGGGAEINSEADKNKISTSTKKVLGEKSWVLPSRESPHNFSKYLLIIFATIILALGFLLIKEKSKN